MLYKHLTIVAYKGERFETIGQCWEYFTGNHPQYNSNNLYVINYIVDVWTVQRLELLVNDLLTINNCQN